MLFCSKISLVLDLLQVLYSTGTVYRPYHPPTTKTCFQQGLSYPMRQSPGLANYPQERGAIPAMLETNHWMFHSPGELGEV